MKKGVVGLCLVAMLVAVAFEAVTADCNPTELSPCLAAITGGQSPSADCCSKLKAQQPCFCTYLKNPALQQYVASPNAKKVAGICGVTIPAKC
ncbi:hypothetical protein ACS0TY_008599 [Phlomoides rotata]